jgi:hypothetical protein
MRTFLSLAILSLLASTCLALIHFAAPQAVIGLIIIANWVFFICTQWKYTRRAKVAELTLPQSQQWDLLQVATLLAFTGAGLIALEMGSPIF